MTLHRYSYVNKAMVNVQDKTAICTIFGGRGALPFRVNEVEYFYKTEL